MPVCTSCGNEVSTITQSGLCPNCARLSMRMQLAQDRPINESQSEAIPAPKESDHTLDGLTAEEQQYVLRMRRESQRKIADAVAALRQRGMSGYYEYKVINISDRYVRGTVNVEKMSEDLNALGLEGWHLVTAYSNDLGVNAVSAAHVGLNRSVSQNILIFERYVSI